MAILKQYVPNDIKRCEKQSSLKEARRLRKLRHSGHSNYDPAIDREFLRLRESVPSIAGNEVSDITIINEAISLICDLEAQLIKKLCCPLAAKNL